MGLNLRSYPIRKIDDNTYYFKTGHGDEYICYFISFSQYFEKFPDIKDNIFAFDLELQAPIPKHRGIDKRISFTVIKAISKFLHTKINAVIYTCDPSEGKGLARARKFKSWYEYFDENSQNIFRASADVDAGGIIIYTAILIHKENKLRDRFIEAFFEFVNDEHEE